MWVGIDVGAKTVEVVWRSEGKNSKPQRFDQSAAGHQQLIQKLKRLKQLAGVVLEATGIYHFDLAVALDEAGLPVSVINPKSTKHFAQVLLKHTKTDGVDAALLAEYGQRITPQRWRAPEPSLLTLRDLGRQINRLTAARTRAKNRLHALQAKRATLKLLIDDEREDIARLDQRIEKLEKAALALIAASPELIRQMECLTAATGVGKATAISVLAEFCILPKHLKAPQISRHAGLDVRLHDSGTSVKRPGRLGKAGNAYIRAAMYMPAMSAIQHDERAKAFYDSLLSRGKKKMQALCAVMRKYLTGLWFCYVHSVPFNSAELFHDCHLANAKA